MNKNHDIEHPIDLLNEVQRIEAPPFLLTRIHAQIQANQKDMIPKQWIWATIGAYCILLTINIFVMREQLTQTDNSSVLIENMNLISTYNLYE